MSKGAICRSRLRTQCQRSRHQHFGLYLVDRSNPRLGARWQGHRLVCDMGVDSHNETLKHLHGLMGRSLMNRTTEPSAAPNAGPPAGPTAAPLNPQPLSKGDRALREIHRHAPLVTLGVGCPRIRSTATGEAKVGPKSHAITSGSDDNEGRCGVGNSVVGWARGFRYLTDAVS